MGVHFFHSTVLKGEIQILHKPGYVHDLERATALSCLLIPVEVFVHKLDLLNVESTGKGEDGGKEF